MRWRLLRAIAATSLLVGCAPAGQPDPPLARDFEALGIHQSDLVASDGVASDDLGYSVAISGDTAVVGTPDAGDGQGAAYVFVRAGSVWTEQQKLIPDAPKNQDWLGLSVAVDGDIAVIGAPYQMDPVKQTWPAGRAIVFERSGTTWAQTAVFTASPQQEGDWFGYSVALSGNIAVVGAPFYDSGGTSADQGAVYVFERSNGAWSRLQILAATDRAYGDTFGRSVAVSGDRILVGAPQDDIGSATDQGSAYSYLRSGATFLFEDKLTVANTTSTLFGGSVRISGSTALIVARGGQGAAYVLERAGTTWNLQTDLLTLPGAPSAGAANGTAITGDIALLGIPYDKAGTTVTQGAAYYFSREGSTWSLKERWLDENAGANRIFGYSVALSSGTALVGAPGDTVGTNAAQGAVHVFELQGAPLGSSCTVGSACASGICTQNVCCNVACVGTCQACRASDTGAPDGTCSTDQSRPACAANTGGAAGTAGSGTGGRNVAVGGAPPYPTAGVAGSAGNGAGGRNIAVGGASPNPTGGMPGSAGNGTGGLSIYAAGAPPNATGGAAGSASDASGRPSVYAAGAPPNATGGSATAGSTSRSTGGATTNHQLQSAAGAIPGGGHFGASNPATSGTAGSQGCDCRIASRRHAADSWCWTLAGCVALFARRRARHVRSVMGARC